MSAHRLPADLGLALGDIGSAVLPPVTASTTLDLGGRGVFTVVVTATATVTLPPAPAGTMGFIFCDDTSVVTVADSGGNFAAMTGTSGTSALLVVATDSNSWRYLHIPGTNYIQQSASGVAITSSVVQMANLPSSDPTVAGALYVDNGTVKQSAG